MAGPHATRAEIERSQFEQLLRLLDALRDNPFYRAKLRADAALFAPTSLADFTARFPFTTKSELVADQAEHPPYGSNLTYPLERYTRCHGTSGSTGKPLRWLDTNESWAWMLGNWEVVHRTAGTTAADKIFFAFSFGPFLGFWTAFESALRLGCLCLPGGGMNTVARLRSIIDHGATVLCCTPTYALHLAETAEKEGIDLAAAKIRTICVAGEPGGSVPAVRERISALWTRLWAEQVPGSDPARAAYLLGPVAQLAAAATYQRFLDHIEVTERVYHALDPADRLRAAVAADGSPAV